MNAAQLISEYLCIGMHHSTKEGQEAINEIILQTSRFSIGDTVYKPSNKPFKSTKKVNTVKGFMLNPYTKKVALTFQEDDSNVEAFRCRVFTTNYSIQYV